jgi:hypothetical protein
MPASMLNPGDQVNYVGTINGYFQDPGTVQPDQGDEQIRILWADGFSLSVLSPGDPMFASLQTSVLTPPSSPNGIASETT